jgi:hypothetical protein
MVGKKLDNWPADTLAAEGSGGMSTNIAGTPYAIGYIDSGHGHEDGLKEIALKNKAGKYLTSLDAEPLGGIANAASEAIKANVMPGSPLDDFSAVSLHNQDGETTWPIVAISYIYVRKDATKLGERACLLKAFLEFILSEEGQGLLPAYGAVGVPKEVLTISNSAVNMLVMPACSAWSFEVDTIKGGGQADYIISKKRRSYYEYGDKVVKGLIGSLQQDILELKQEVKTSPAPAPAPAPAPIQDVNNDDDEDSINWISIIALVISILAIIINIFLGYSS